MGQSKNNWHIFETDSSFYKKKDKQLRYGDNGQNEKLKTKTKREERGKKTTNPAVSLIICAIIKRSQSHSLPNGKFSVSEKGIKRSIYTLLRRSCSERDKDISAHQLIALWWWRKERRVPVLYPHETRRGEAIVCARDWSKHPPLWHQGSGLRT